VAGHLAACKAAAVTATRHYHAPDGTFRKVLPRDQARREVAGWKAVSGLLPVPRLWGVRDAADDECELIYADVFATGRSTRLLADSINAADREPKLAITVRTLVDNICDSLLTATHATRSVAPLEECVPDLHLARLQPGGRLDRWYNNPPPATWIIDGQQLDLHDLAGQTIVADGTELAPGWPLYLAQTRRALTATSRWITAITQGDPTEPNITEPLCWLDLEHAGRNALAADLADLLWYLLGMGGWLVPTYQPRVYQRTLCTPVPPLATPVIDYLKVTARHIEINYTWHTGTGRHTAIATLIGRLNGDIGTALAPGGDVTASLRPFLALRILGVIPLHQMTGPHAITCLAKLAELFQPGTTLNNWSASTRACCRTT